MKNQGCWFAAVVLTFVCLVFGNIIWQTAHDTTPAPAVEQQDTSTYEPEMQALCKLYADRGISATWPSGGSQDVIRIDLPRTDGDLSDHDARQMAGDVYSAFVSVRTKANVLNPDNCIAHLYDDTGKQVAHASESGSDN